MSQSFKVTDKNSSLDPEYIRKQKDVAKRIKRSRKTLWKQFKEQGYFENDDFKVEKIQIL